MGAVRPIDREPWHVPLHASHAIETPCSSSPTRTSNSQQILAVQATHQQPIRKKKKKEKKRANIA